MKTSYIHQSQSACAAIGYRPMQIESFASAKMHRLCARGNELELDAYLALESKASLESGSVRCDFSRPAKDACVREFEEVWFVEHHPNLYRVMQRYGKRGLPVPRRFITYYLKRWNSWLDAERLPSGGFRTFREDSPDSARRFIYTEAKKRNAPDQFDQGQKY